MLSKLIVRCQVSPQHQEKPAHAHMQHQCLWCLLQNPVLVECKLDQRSVPCHALRVKPVTTAFFPASPNRFSANAADMGLVFLVSRAVAVNGWRIGRNSKFKQLS